MTISIAQIKAARALLDWGQADLAREVGLSQPTLTRTERGQVTPKPETLEKIRKRLTASGIFFLGKTGVIWMWAEDW